MKEIAVYCSSSQNIAPEFFNDAREVGHLITEGGGRVVCGGGREGLMAAVIEGSAEAGGKPVGVLPEFMMDYGWNHPLLADPIVTAGMRERKAEMLSRSQGVIVLPGGIGTFEEMTEAMSFKKLKLWSGPIVMLNTDGYYNPFHELMERMYDAGFAPRPASPLYRLAATPAEAVALALGE